MEADGDYDPTSKERLASILPQIAAIISMIGSYIVIREVLVDHRQRRGKAIPRILLEMCIADLLFSSGWFLATWPSPSDVENLWHNVGNIATCNFQGFLLQFGLTASPLFNIFLATFYLLMVRYNWTDARLQKLEWWVHGGVWIFSLACSIFPIFLGLYNNAWTVCWFESVPAGCKDSYRYGDEATCVRGDNAWIYAVAFTVFPVLICVFLSFVIMGMIYSFVRKTEKRMSRYAGSQSRLNAMTSKLSKQASSILSSSRHGKQSFRHFEPSMTPGTSVPPTGTISMRESVVQTQLESPVRLSYHHAGTSMDSERSITSNLPMPTVGSDADHHVESTGAERPSLRRAGTSMESATSSQRSFGNSTSRSQVVARQGIFYTLSFVVTYALHCFCTLVFFTTRKYWYWLHLSMYFFLALQGFFNALVFTRGRHMKTPEGRIFQKLVFWKCKVVKKMSAHRTPTDTTFGHSEHVDGPDEENTDSSRQFSSTNPQLPIHDVRDDENMDTTRRVSFIDQQLAISKEGEPIHDGDGDEENTDSTTCRVSLNDQELAIPEESEPIHDDDRYEGSINSTTYHHSFNQELTIPKETEPVHYDGPDEESSQRS